MKKLTIKEYVEKATNVHKGKYSYRNSNYINSKSDICVTCPEHGDFWLNASSHLMGTGCSKCAGLYKPTTEEFIEKARKIHGDKYIYTNTEYVNSQTPIKVICPKHGEFTITPNHLLSGVGCSDCGAESTAEKLSLGLSTFVERANKVHKGKYTYEKSVYKNNRTRLCITCPIHGDFSVTPSHHLDGVGCPDCFESKLENEVREYFLQNNIDFKYQHTFEWLVNKRKLPLDFYLPQYNIAIECQGIQHFSPVAYFGGKERFLENQERDMIKKRLCEEHEIKLLYYSNLTKYKTFLDETVYHNINNLIETIKQ